MTIEARVQALEGQVGQGAEPVDTIGGLARMFQEGALVLEPGGVVRAGQPFERYRKIAALLNRARERQQNEHRQAG